MSILDTSVSGMLSNSNWLSTISQNVANANTPGYKNVDTEFTALVDQASSAASQVAGVTTSVRSLNAIQGQVAAGTTTTDLAIEGAGYFVVSDGSGNISLTRNGSFVPDSSGNLVNAAGYYLMGSNLQNGGTLTVNSLSGLQKVNTTNATSSSSPSTAASISANLPSTATAIASANLPSANSASSTYTDETSLVAYDNLGGAHTLNIYFSNTGANSWQVDVFNASASAAGGGFPYSSVPLASQALTFSPTTGAALGGSSVNLTVPGGQSLTLDLSHTTQLSSAFAVSSATINGSAPGTLTGVSIAQDGTLSFEYGNGSTIAAYKIPLANVASPDNLTSTLGGSFLANYQSGAAIVGVAGTGGLGSINSDSVEASTVDLATELTDMIQAQSAYEANSKVFQTGSKLLDVLNNLQA